MIVYVVAIFTVARRSRVVVILLHFIYIMKRNFKNDIVFRAFIMLHFGGREVWRKNYKGLQGRA